MSDKIDNFLNELKDLFEKHKMHISDGSCGCCGYTALVDTDTNEVLLDVDNWTDTRLRKLL